MARMIKTERFFIDNIFGTAVVHVKGTFPSLTDKTLKVRKFIKEACQHATVESDNYHVSNGKDCNYFKVTGLRVSDAKTLEVLFTTGFSAT